MFVPRTLTSIARSGATHVLETYTAASLLSTLTTLGLTTNLKLCLDAGEGDSYTSGQSWLDLSGNGYDFFRGATSGGTTDDPTFNGVADALSSAEYWSFDGGDYFRYDSANETWMENLHKDNAVFTYLVWAYVAAAGANQGLIGNNNANTALKDGHAFFISTLNNPRIIITKEGGVVLNITSAAAFSSTGWYMFAVSLDEAASTGIIGRDATYTSFTSTYPSPGSAAADYTLEIGAFGNAGAPLANGSRIGMVAAWEGVALTAWQLEQIYNKTRRRFGV